LTAPVLIIGRTGQMARALAGVCERQGRGYKALGRPGLDLNDGANVIAAIEALKPAAIINTAAYTAVDRAESELDAAFSVNRDGAQAVAEAAARCKARLVHLSTDYVFSGHMKRALREDDPAEPVNVYGASKRAGEIAVAASCPEAAILRTSGIFSHEGQNFVRTMVRLAGERRELEIVDDQIIGPTPAFELAGIVLRLLDTRGAGVFHASGRPETSWADLAGAIFERLERRGWRTPCVRRVPSEAYAAPARRPARSVLADTRLSGHIGEYTLDWRPALDRVIDALAAERETGGHVERR